VNILVFSQNRNLPDKLRLRRRKGVVEEVRYANLSDFSDLVKAASAPTLCYLDVSAIEESKIAVYLRTLKKKDNILYGIIDPRGKFKDAARLFHNGAVDYLDRRSLADGSGMRRLGRVLDYAQCTHPSVLAAAAVSAEAERRAPYALSGNDWSAVVPGEDYTFAMMFVELDGKEQMERRYGAKNLSAALSSFRAYIEGFTKTFGGRPWMWFGFGGIILFPFDAKTCLSLTCGFRLMLFKHLYDVEGSHFPHFLSFRTVLQIGNTTYTEEDTGHIVSDSLNSIFHLGQQFIPPGSFCVTDEVLQFGHAVLRSYFVPAGTFEGRKILRMRRLVHQAKRKLL
jgi:hypothetical protein